MRECQSILVLATQQFSRSSLTQCVLCPEPLPTIVLRDRIFAITFRRGDFMRLVCLSLFALILSCVCLSQSTPSSKPGPGFSIDNIDKSIDPCVDFYHYACGNWIKNSEIPGDRPAWQSFSELDESNLHIERQILEKAAAGGASRNAIDQKIGDLYGSCMDETAVNAKGISPLKPVLERIAAVSDKPALIEEIGRLHLIGANALF